MTGDSETLISNYQNPAIQNNTIRGILRRVLGLLMKLGLPLKKNALTRFLSFYCE